jgi:hypothetical protein
LWYPGVFEALAKQVESSPEMTQAEKEEWYNQQINSKLQEALSEYESLAFMPFDPRVKRTESTVRSKYEIRIFPGKFNTNKKNNLGRMARFSR